MRESVIYQDIQEQKAREIALKLLNKGVDIEVIAEATGLTVEQIHSSTAKKVN